MGIMKLAMRTETGAPASPASIEISADVVGHIERSMQRAKAEHAKNKFFEHSYFTPVQLTTVDGQVDGRVVADRTGWWIDYPGFKSGTNTLAQARKAASR